MDSVLGNCPHESLGFVHCCQISKALFFLWEKCYLFSDLNQHGLYLRDKLNRSHC